MLPVYKSFPNLFSTTCVLAVLVMTNLLFTHYLSFKITQNENKNPFSPSQST